MKNLWIKLYIFVMSIICVIIIYFLVRGHFELKIQDVVFTESAKELDNPERGFYYIYGFRIKEFSQDFEAVVNEKLKNDTDTTIAMIQINLQAYAKSEISEIGIDNIDKLFCALKKIDKKYIIRVLYDWHGENMQYEPKSIDIIMKHMEQLGPIINKYQENIYLLQGLFIGNWGEMNGTRYSSQENLKKLADQMLTHTDEDIYLSVRMPAQWRMSTEIAEISDIENYDALRIGLYNDAIMGNESDYGTYLTEANKTSDFYNMRNRDAELKFQNELCRYVPNGGEAITDNPLNDFENAKDTLRKMRISYLNIDYDKNVLDKWAKSYIEDNSIYNGMNGLDYIERHLGYRFVINNIQMDYHVIKDKLNVNISLKNVGFAPIYHDKKLVLTVCDEEGEVVYTSEFEQDLRTLYGGEDADKVLELKQTIPVFGWESSKYEIYFCIQDEYSEEMIMLANEQEPKEYGYKIGTVTGGIR